MRFLRGVPGWVVGVVIIVMAMGTVYAVVKTQSALGWRAQSGPDYPKNFGEIFYPGFAALQDTWSSAAQGQPNQGAGTATLSNAVKVPQILAGSAPVHAERGTCTACHSVLSPRGSQIPQIQVSSRPPHDNRGLCTNCHVLTEVVQQTPGQGATSATPVAFAPSAPAMAAQAPVPTEGGWNGIEVTPITQLTGTQYGVPVGTAGLIVAETEASGALAGIKPGDVIYAVNGAPTPTLTDFFRATQNGMLPRGSVNLFRKGEPMAMYVSPAAAAAATPVPAPPGVPVGIPVALPMGVPMAAAGLPAAGAPQMTPPTGEWLGLELAPISTITATQFNLPPGLSGLLIVEAEAQGATIGAKAGDVLQFVNGVPTVDLTTFFLSTKNGTLSDATIVLWRKGEQMTTKISQSVAAAPAPLAPRPFPPANFAQGAGSAPAPYVRPF
jgi:hypothetical protein